MREVDPLQTLRALVNTHGTQGKAATALGISPAYLSDLLSNRRNINDKLLARLGLRRIVVETYIDPDQSFSAKEIAHGLELAKKHGWPLARVPVPRRPPPPRPSRALIAANKKGGRVKV